MHIYSMDQTFYIYILSRNITRNRILFVDLTANLYRRIYRHRLLLTPCNSVGLELVYYEFHSILSAAMRRKNEIKSWDQQKIAHFIEASNPQWQDLDVLNSVYKYELAGLG